MALYRICFVLVCMLSAAISQPLEESVFRTLTSEEIRALDLSQNPGLFEYAARTGERVRINITALEQGAVLQDGVNALIDCYPWLMRFPGGSIRWFSYAFRSLDQDIMDVDDRELVETGTGSRLRIEGEFDRYLNITRSLILTGPQVSTRAIYECQVCVARSNPIFRVCHPANVTVPGVGRAPIIDSASPNQGPDEQTPDQAFYRIGSTICVIIGRDQPVPNTVQSEVITLSCPVVPEIQDENIPPPIPQAVRTWIHTSLDGRVTAIAGSQLGGNVIQETNEFAMLFPLISANSGRTRFTFNTPPATSLAFRVGNITQNVSLPGYQELLQAFGTWTCVLNNSLGEDRSSTFISDRCGEAASVPTILARPCSFAGPVISGNLVEVERGQENPIPIGCDVCIEEVNEVWLTILCPTNIDDFPNETLTITWEDGDGNILQGSSEGLLLVQRPGTYQCTATFSESSMSRETTVSFKPNVQLHYSREGLPLDSGCQRLLTMNNNTFGPNDVCVFLGETLNIQCDAPQGNVSAVVREEGGQQTYDNISIIIQQVDEGVTYQCDVAVMASSGFNAACAAAQSITLRVFSPAIITTERAMDGCDGIFGELYGPTDPSPTIGQTYTICCRVNGIPRPTAAFFRTVLDPDTGFTDEVLLNSTTRLTVGTDRITISDYMAIDDGTYICRVENIAGRDARYAVTHGNPVVYAWRTTEFSECEPRCQDGVRTRTAWCESVPDGLVVADRFCCNLLRPNLTQSCADDDSLTPCYLMPLWRTSEFSDCSSGCAGGYRRRDVWCAIPATGETVPNHECRQLHEYKPAVFEFCFNTCCREDVYPIQCRHLDRVRCGEPVYQQFCCWTCGITDIP